MRDLGFDFERARQQASSIRLRPLTAPAADLPSRVDLRDRCSPVGDQQELGACTAFAVGRGLRECLQRLRGEAPPPPSPLFLYYETRRLRGTPDRDSGATITDAMHAIAGAGVAPEAAWPYDLDAFAAQPPASAYADAVAWRLASGTQLAGLDDMKSALARSQPVAFGMCIYSYFRDLGAEGKLAMPQDGDIMVGGHAVLAVGYDDPQRVLIVRNSFGERWGAAGYFYLPYAYAAEDRVLDLWTAR